MIDKTRLKTLGVITLLVVILGSFAYYIKGHPDIINAIKHIRPWLLVVLLVCYGILLLWLMGIYNATLRLCAPSLRNRENLLLTIYSTLANFFLPLQSGPGVRAAYLKRRHRVPVSSYIMSSLMYFAIYAMISAGLLFAATSYWWLAFPAILAAAGVSFLVIKIAGLRFQKKSPNINLRLSRGNLTWLLLLTVGQTATQALIYGIELHSLQTHGSIRQVISYTGAANFSLFVSLTPGAIGFREAFLEFSRGIHHYTTTNILSANLLDRGVFIVFLGILLIIMLVTHARERLKLK